MRSFIGGLLGLCLGLALLPQDASARTDSRTSAQSSSTARTAAAASRPATPRPGVTRTTTASRSATAGRSTTASRGTATPQRQAALAPRGTTSGSSALRLRAGNSRQASAVPYARQPAATTTRGLRQTAVATCTTRNGRRTCAPAATRTASTRWTGGLAPAAFSQTGCPDGTIATMAIGHSDITRCVPL
ncbi:hypothetical protein [Sediminicoccus rosea]|uniref:Uncharacterized protein n=1 Tax=Sediminicoccus rosea TaxID=1225128 RepID=A0ABZ0PFQ7_9PROT|nr:hypothetical protein [Sediminicoccus rosea]WPB84543.1 hypothetical protein R9Z33_20900 [Sediminicoccus rosea]